MSNYELKFYYGDYKWRQLSSNHDKIDLYIEYHLNYYSKSTNYTVCKVPPSANSLSLEFAKEHSRLVNKVFDIPLYEIPENPHSGVINCKKGGKSTLNLNFLRCPGVILLPVFISNPSHVELLLERGGIDKLSDILVQTIRNILPERGNIGLSVGHKYQKTTPMDRGALAYGHSEFSEADISENILLAAKIKLENDIEVITEPYEWKVEEETILD